MKEEEKLPVSGGGVCVIMSNLSHMAMKMLKLKWRQCEEEERVRLALTSGMWRSMWQMWPGSSGKARRRKAGKASYVSIKENQRQIIEDEI